MLARYSLWSQCYNDKVFNHSDSKIQSEVAVAGKGTFSSHSVSKVQSVVELLTMYSWKWKCRKGTFCSSCIIKIQSVVCSCSVNKVQSVVTVLAIYSM